MVGMIYAVSPEGVIGVGGTIPWRYPGDWKRFKRLTMGCTVVMGRRTFESIGKPLAGRRNIVVTSRPLAVEGVESAASVEDAMALAGSGDVWFIGGERIYQQAMKYAEVIDVTYVPDSVNGRDVARAPTIDESRFDPGPLLPHEEEPALTRRVYTRKS